jgi:sulfite reductase beta subunit-like hemoprotein
MSESESDTDAAEEVSSRQRGLDAAIRYAIEQAGESSRWRREFSSDAVQRKAEGDVPDRTMRRALHDARHLGWIEKKRNKWAPGERAERYQSE